MKINYPFFEAIYIDRPNRFISRVFFDKSIIDTHLPDPGRLKELLVPGSRVLIKKERGKHRKTSYSTQAVYKGDMLVSLNTLLPNVFMEYLLKNKKVDFLNDWTLDKKEVPCGSHRFDFKLKNGNNFRILEVKSVSLVDKNIAKFPDAVTSRGRKHIEKLGQMAKKGMSTMVLFMIQRPDANFFRPEWEIDPQFSYALYNSWKKGLLVRVINIKMTKSKIHYLGEIPFNLDPPFIKYKPL